jgi:DNA-binding response OmpR family regulator
LAHVVVAVSNGAVRSSIAMACRAVGHRVFAAADAGELLGMVKDATPDVLFLDPSLARIETVEPLRVMRLENRLLGVRIVLVDDRRSDGGAWSPLVRQIVDGVLDSFRGADVLKVLDAVIGIGKANAAVAGAGSPPRTAAPAAAPAARPAVPAPGAPPAPAAPAHPSQTPAYRASAADPSRPTIVLVEDAPHLRALLGIRLESEGWNVCWFGTAEDALRVVESNGCDAVLSDINLPGMSGDQFVGLVRKRFPGVSCILMTALPRERWPRVPPAIRIFGKPIDMVALDRCLLEIRNLRSSAPKA